MHLGGSRQTKPPHQTSTERRPWTTLLAGLALFFVSLSLVIHANALPAEAHITETWYSYKQQLAYDFQANVETGSIYKSSPIPAKDLLQLRLPTEPATYRRLTVAKLTDSLILSLPYRFTAEKDADIQVTYWIDGTFTVPNLWKRPYPFMERTVIQRHGKEVTLDQLQVEIPIKQLMAELAQLTQVTRINQEQAEIQIRPAFEVKVNGLREPVTAALAPEITLNIRGSNYAIEVDEPQTFRDGRNYEVNVVLPATVSLLGLQVEVNLLRQVLTTLAVIVGVVTAAVLAVHWLRKKNQDSYDIKRLGSQLITASKFEISYTAALVDLQSMKELLQLQVQMERPIIQVGKTYYLADENTCYRFTEPEPSIEAEAVLVAEATLAESVPVAEMTALIEVSPVTEVPEAEELTALAEAAVAAEAPESAEMTAVAEAEGTPMDEDPEEKPY
ncbi:MAG TPA: DUF5305 family protein [Symbiobacteriaceae bacterium]|nr:DUF5305 family protein [Symbiobacteriaceae bacterium]